MNLFNEYNFLLLWIVFMVLIASQINIYEPVSVQGEKVDRVRLYFAILMFLPIFLLASFGDKLGDVWLYVASYKNIQASFGDLLRTITERPKGYGFICLEIIIKSLFGDNELWFRSVIALIQSIPIILLVRKYSSNYFLSVFLFVASGMHIGWMMNGLRQGVAISIALLVFPLILNKKYLYAIAIVLLAATIHATALVMLPVVFVIQGKAMDKKTIIYVILGMGVLFILLRTGLWNMMFQGSDYEETAESIQLFSSKGTSVLRVAVNSIPAIIAFVGRKNLQKKNDTVINVCANLSIVTAGIYIVAMLTDGINIGRLPGYVAPYNLILLPYLIDNVFDIKSSKTIIFIMIALYLLYYYYQMHFVSGLI